MLISGRVFWSLAVVYNIKNCLKKTWKTDEMALRVLHKMWSLKVVSRVFKSLTMSRICSLLFPGSKYLFSLLNIRFKQSWRRHVTFLFKLLSFRRYLMEFLISVKFIWNNSYLYCGCRWKWNVIITVNFPISNWKEFFFKLLLSNCLNWKIYCDNHISLFAALIVIIISTREVFLRNRRHLLQFSTKNWTKENLRRQWKSQNWRAV